MAKVGILTFSDGRDFVHEGAGVGSFARNVENDIVGALKAAGHEVVRAREVVWTSRLATNEARRVADERPDLTIFNIPVWAFPHFSMLAAQETPGPLLLFSNINPDQPGMVGIWRRGLYLRSLNTPRRPLPDARPTRLLRTLRRRDQRGPHAPVHLRGAPHAFARMDASAGEILSRYGSNHIHAIPADHVEELRVVCELLDVDYEGFGGA